MTKLVVAALELGIGNPDRLSTDNNTRSQNNFKRRSSFSIPGKVTLVVKRADSRTLSVAVYIADHFFELVPGPVIIKLTSVSVESQKNHHVSIPRACPILR